MSQECNAGAEQCEVFGGEEAMAAVQQTNKDFLLHASSMGGRNHNPYPMGTQCVCVCVRVCFGKIDYDLYKVLYTSLTEHLNLPKSEGGADEFRYQTSDSFITHTDRTQEENILTY